MMKTRGTLLSTILILLGGVLAPSSPATVAGPAELGEIVFEDLQRGALDEASARRVADGDLVKCSSLGAIVRLDGGQVLKFDSNTAAVFETDASGRVELRVLSGRVSMVGENHRWLTAGAGSFFAVRPTEVDPAVAERLLLEEDRAGANGIERRRDRRSR